MKIKDIRSQYTVDQRIINSLTDNWDKCIRLSVYGDTIDKDRLLEDLYDYPIRTGKNNNVYAVLIDKETETIQMFGDEICIDDVCAMLDDYDSLFAYGIVVMYDKITHRYNGRQLGATRHCAAFLSRLQEISIEDDDIVFDTDNLTNHLYGLKTI